MTAWTAVKLTRQGLNAGSPLVRDVGSTFLVRLLLLAIGAVTSVLVARALGPELRGVYGVGAVIVNLGIQFCNAGLHSSNTYYVSSRRELLPRLLSNSLLITIAGGGGASMMLAALSWVAPAWAPVTGAVLYIALAWLPLALGALLLQNLLIGISAIGAYNAFEVAGRVVSVVLLGAACAIRWVTPELVMMSGLLGAVATLVLSLHKLGAVAGGFPRPDLALLRSQAAYGMRPYLATLFGYVVLKGDILMVKYMAGATATGHYSLASTLADFVYILPSTVAMMLFPRLAATGDAQARWRKARLAALGMGAVMAVIAAGALAGAGPAFGVVFGPAYRPSTAPFVLLCVAQVPYAANNILSVYLAASGFPWISVVVWAGGAATNLLLNVLLIPSLGIVGAALASIITYTAVLIPHIWLARRMVAASRTADFHAPEGASSTVPCSAN